ncbi:MAG: Fur family transcriptional regulator [Candidatus Gracilibacteria bacterium]|jgi:Fur family ferric uptake transcriptional regulator
MSKEITFNTKKYVEHALQSLKDNGLKITDPRKMIVNLLAKSEKALSPYEMRDLLKKQKIHADVVTIYRVLEVLEKMSLAHKVLAVNGYIRCSTTEDETACHHYLLCKNCRKVEEVEGENLHSLQTKIAKDYKFEITSHYLEFTGLCSECSQKPKRK